MKLSVVVVSYEAIPHLQQCIAGILAALPPNCEIIVVDNATKNFPLQQLQKKFSQVIFHANANNVGFSAANNLGAKMAKGEYLVLLNPDTLIPEDFFEKLIHFADGISDLGAIGTRMINIQGQFLPESKRNIPTLANSWQKLSGFLLQKQSKYYNSTIEENAVGEVEVITGACMFMRRKTYLQIGGLDERYFMYGEDIDLCYSFIQAGFRNFYLGEITILHYKGESTSQNQKYLDRFYGAMDLFVNKYYSNWLYKSFLKTGIYLRKQLHAQQLKKAKSQAKMHILPSKSQLLKYPKYTHKQMIEHIDQYGANYHINLQVKDMDMVVNAQ